jgi:hypothetical protein
MQKCIFVTHNGNGHYFLHIEKYCNITSGVLVHENSKT